MNNFLSEKKLVRKNKRKIIFRNIFFGFLGTVFILLLWFIVGKIAERGMPFSHFSEFLPIPSFRALFVMLGKIFFWRSVLVSILRVVLGIIIAAFFGIPIGLLIGYYRVLKDLTNLPIQFLRMISPLAWMPIAILVFSTFEKAILFLIVIASVWPIILSAAQGVENVNKEWIKMARNQGASDYQVLFRVVFPASVPYIVSGLRLAIGVAWIVLVPAEFLGVSSGLGYLINDARDTMEYSNLMALVIAIGILGFLIDGIFQTVLRKIDWRRK